MGESSVRFSRRKAFATLYREVAQDARLSLEARGLLLLMASLPEDWEYSVAGLSKMAGCGKDKLRRILGELENVGYLAREQSHDSGGKFAGNVYVIQDDAPPLSENPTTGKPVDGFTRHRETRRNSIYKTTVEEKKIPPKAPQGGKRPKKYDLDEDAKPILRSYVGEDRELAQALGALIEVRVAKKAVNSARAIAMLLRELDKLSQGRRGDKLLILSQSVTNSWKGVFPLKGSSAQPTCTQPAQGESARVLEEEGTYLL